MLPTTIDVKGVRYPVTVYVTYYHDQDVMEYEARMNTNFLFAYGRTLQASLENLAMEIIAKEMQSE